MKYRFGKPPEGKDVLWRCVTQRYSVIINAEAEIFGVSQPELLLEWHEVIKRTPKGAWLNGRFVLLTAKKKWACETEQEAIKSFVARKKRQINILTAQLARAKEDLALVEEKDLA